MTILPEAPLVNLTASHVNAPTQLGTYVHWLQRQMIQSTAVSLGAVDSTPHARRETQFSRQFT
ncbi:MAG: hypothetical protein AAFX01_04580 [Cyanobacteria bacterium J06638_28]